MGIKAVWRVLVLSFASAVWLASCGPEGPPVDPGDDDFPLSDLGAILEGAPEDRGTSLPSDSKADEIRPAEFYLLEYQTPVRSQGSRGTCTIFSTVALMESLYMSEGTIPTPDFSEQFLQWSVKNEVRAFQTSEGSNNQSNLQAISRHGIVLETLWPYEGSPWGTGEDQACTGDNRPTRCYTNGDPPEVARAGQRFTLPGGRWINPRASSIQGHMVSTRTPVVVAGDFFYQSWNHGRSQLTTSPEYRRLGYVLTPNDADVADSSGDRRAGHGILLVGWNNEMEVQRVDGQGNPLLGPDGEPLFDRGFFLFKNSWGTGRFGVDNPMGDGYGWISYAYVERYLTAYVAGLPSVRVTEVCNDGVDNTFNGLVDCDDPQCSDDSACIDPGDSFENDTVVAIPDADPTGVSTAISVTEGGTISSLAIAVDITHTYRGDLLVRLVRREDGLAVVLHDREGGSADDIQRTFTVSGFEGTDAAGTYELHVADLAPQDVGTLNRWSLDITRCAPGECDPPPPSLLFEDEVGGLTIPDDDPNGISRQLEVLAEGQIRTLSVAVEITHPFPPDLTVRFSRVGGREVVLFDQAWTESEDLVRTFEVTGFDRVNLRGDWQLTVVDGAPADEGSLQRWSLHFTTH